VLESYQEGDVVSGKVTKVVTFGAFVEILPGVEGLVHISELAQHHVENPREVVSQGDLVNVKIIEVDAERRRLSLSLKRVEEGEQPQPLPEGAEPLRPNIDLSEQVFAEEPLAEAELEEPLAEEPLAEAELEEPLAEEPLAEEPLAEEPLAEEPLAEAEPEEPVAEATLDPVEAAPELEAEESPGDEPALEETQVTAPVDPDEAPDAGETPPEH
jgi:small subunit ribosomal protein S1